ncbi:class I SAM-dependent methyltransferase [Magnetovibrio blakemorei]|uniref:Methyltransferase type 11 domain-containing protein n=1 Tax=Magnetovibrio blakemorei TaxID=28181 RepID=A0A1E5Q6D5_9PROT|nr:class I SAM-dependent methyltransferase [Magnetovibrio blakemorei]OEJ66396.1 hypothetical protein BEN30_12170 [Magnetovibrio blakemorei]
MVHGLTNELEKRHAIWIKKPVLRVVYSDIYARIISQCAQGKQILEVGGGTGIGKIFLPNAVTLDIVSSPWTDVVGDCHLLPFPDESLDIIVMVDVWHHLQYPIDFLNEAARTLRKGGRIVMAEPAITPFSAFFYKWLHYEPLELNVDPFIRYVDNPNRNPLFDSNQAIPTLLMGRYRHRLEQEIEQLSIIKNEHFSLWAYPLSGGYRSWSLVPSVLVRPLLKLERLLEPFVGQLIGFRLLAVFEKNKYD